MKKGFILAVRLKRVLRRLDYLLEWLNIRQLLGFLKPVSVSITQSNTYDCLSSSAFFADRFIFNIKIPVDTFSIWPISLSSDDPPLENLVCVLVPTFSSPNPWETPTVAVIVAGPDASPLYQRVLENHMCFDDYSISRNSLKSVLEIYVLKMVTKMELMIKAYKINTFLLSKRTTHSIMGAFENSRDLILNTCKNNFNRNHSVCWYHNDQPICFIWLC